MGQASSLCALGAGDTRQVEDTSAVRTYRFLIVGGGTAAGYICRELVSHGVGPGAIGVVTDEPVAPYERPVLTKAYLHPPGAEERLRLPAFHTCRAAGEEVQTEAWYRTRGIDFVWGRATGVDLQEKTVDVAGQACKYESMIIATGSRPVLLGVPGAAAASAGGEAPPPVRNVHYIRNVQDSARLVAAMETSHPGSHVVVVGAGYLGLEAAAALVGWDVKVTVAFPGARLINQFPDMFAEWLEKEYLALNVNFMRGASVHCLAVNDGLCNAVHFKSGKTLHCDLVVVAIGAEPNVEWCSGLEMCGGGFLVDGSMRTSDPDVYAVGDVCTFPSMYGGLMRVEFVDHARRSAAQAARAALGLEPEPYSYLPYNYMQVFRYTSSPIVFNFFGDLTGYVLAEELSSNRLGAIWVRKGKLVGCMMMGSPGPSPEETAKLRQLALRQPEAGDGVVDAFKEAGLC